MLADCVSGRVNGRVNDYVNDGVNGSLHTCLDGPWWYRPSSVIVYPKSDPIVTAWKMGR